MDDTAPHHERYMVCAETHRVYRVFPAEGESFCAHRVATSPMATTLLRRQLRLAQPLRCFSVHHPRAQVTEHSNRAASLPGGSAFDRPHTVEDLHGMPAVDVLSETGTRKDTSMRHFTGV